MRTTDSIQLPHGGAGPAAGEASGQVDEPWPTEPPARRPSRPPARPPAFQTLVSQAGTVLLWKAPRTFSKQIQHGCSSVSWGGWVQDPQDSRSRCSSPFCPQPAIPSTARTLPDFRSPLGDSDHLIHAVHRVVTLCCLANGNKKMGSTQYRRHLFSWEKKNYVWTGDRPKNALPLGHTHPSPFIHLRQRLVAEASTLRSPAPPWAAGGQAGLDLGLRRRSVWPRRSHGAALFCE